MKFYYLYYTTCKLLLSIRSLAEKAPLFLCNVHNNYCPPPYFCALYTKISNSTCQSWHGITAGVCNQCVTLYVTPCRVDSMPFARITFTLCVITYKRERLICWNSLCTLCTKNPTRLVRVGMASPQVYVINALHCMLSLVELIPYRLHGLHAIT